jgi:hypothetical protein
MEVADFSLKQEPEYYNNIKMQYGIELEICIRVNSECLQRKGDVSKNLSFDTLKEKFEMYFENILAKAPEASRQLYPIVALNQIGQVYIYNVLDPYKRDGSLNYYKATSTDKQKIMNYEIPIFEEDVTVVCGDSSSEYLEGPFANKTIINRNTGTGIINNESIGIECISPKLSITGIPDDQKISESLLPYLNLIGLNNPKCFMSNKSSGLHVNISAVDLIKNESIPITKYPLFLFVLNEYLVKERSYYNKEFRIDPSMWSKPVYRMINQLPNLKLPNEFTKKDLYDLFTKYSKTKSFSQYLRKSGNIGYPSSTSLTTKDYGIKIKSDELLEFRVFRSEKKIQKIIDNILYAMVIIMRGILSQWENTSSEGVINTDTILNIPGVKGGYKKTRRYINKKGKLGTRRK